MQVHYSSDGELSGIVDLDTLINNLGEYNKTCFHGDAIDLAGLRKALESAREFRGFHEFGQFLVKPL